MPRVRLSEDMLAVLQPLFLPSNVEVIKEGPTAEDYRDINAYFPNLLPA